MAMVRERQLTQAVRDALGKNSLTATQVIEEGFEYVPQTATDFAILTRFGAAWFYIWKSTGLLPLRHLRAALVKQEFRLALSQLKASFRVNKK